MNDRPWEPWIRRAKSNLARAKHGKHSEDVLYEDLAFDAQQAAEKSLKALLLSLGATAPRTHSIGYLLNMIERNCDIPDSAQGTRCSGPVRLCSDNQVPRGTMNA